MYVLYDIAIYIDTYIYIYICRAGACLADTGVSRRSCAGGDVGLTYICTYITTLQDLPISVVGMTDETRIC